jgi:hypothetical protein
VQDGLNRAARLIRRGRATHALRQGAARASANRLETGANRAIVGSPWQFLPLPHPHGRGNI